jgi:menaquinone-specific isochorismate synthase
VSTPIGLLLSLNPTPAVCGESRPVATEFIRSQESFDRGFYGGPVGFVSSTVCEFCVAIRSVLCQPRKLHVFAGAGMVPGSGPLDEWNETAMKMR